MDDVIVPPSQYRILKLTLAQRAWDLPNHPPVGGPTLYNERKCFMHIPAHLVVEFYRGESDIWTMPREGHEESGYERKSLTFIRVAGRVNRNGDPELIEVDETPEQITTMRVL